ncbi:hypothetical protein DFH06DRAFT_721653 [Mycena polygramma]|nr:hypothetical protein DFH06DRAFT_721653 [Mycena polygramma]
MRVSIYTEVEPPEQRPCPPLPLDGPILLQVLFVPSPADPAPSPAVPAPSAADPASSAADPAPSAAIPAPSASGDIAIPVVHPQSSEVPAVQPPSTSPGLTLRGLTALLIRAVLVLSLFWIVWTVPAGGIKTSGHNRRDVPAFVSCPAWQGSDPLCSASCPRPYLGSSLLQYGPYLCPTDARRGDVDSMARGLARTSSALDVKRVHIKLCRLSARRGLAACLIMGYLNRSIMFPLIMGYLIMGIIKTKLNHPLEGTLNMKSSLHTSFQSLVGRAGKPNHNFIQMTPPIYSNGYPFQGGCVASLITGNPFNYLERFADCAPTSAAASPSSSGIFGGGARQTINGRRLSPHLVHANVHAR